MDTVRRGRTVQQYQKHLDESVARIERDGRLVLTELSRYGKTPELQSLQQRTETMIVTARQLAQASRALARAQPVGLFRAFQQCRALARAMHQAEGIAETLSYSPYLPGSINYRGRPGAGDCQIYG